MQVLALTAAGRPVGLLALSAGTATGSQREPLMLFANQIALAVERAKLRDQVLATRLNQEVSRLAKMLVAAVSHDLRAPLATIKASSSTLADSELDIDPQARQDLVRAIDVQADRLAELVRNLLDMSRIQAGVLQPRYAAVSLADLVATVVSDLAPTLRGHLVQVSFPPMPLVVRADAVLISRVLTNLMENAVRHGPKGTPITIRVTGDEPGMVTVSVTDHGRGISPDRREEIFGLFTRRPDDTGAGVGLSIAKTFVEAHGQRVWVEDVQPTGTRFCFTLPLAQADAGQAAADEEPELASRAHH
jgi:two-component system sensor histidine kinase KdpD